MSKRKFQEELARHVEKPFLPHLVPELEMKKKKQKLPPPPVVGRCPILDMKLSWNGSPEIIVRTMLVCRANVPVLSQALVEVYKIPGVLRRNACGIARFDSQLSNSNAGRAYTQSCSLRVGAHHTRETFEIAPLQDDHDILLPWCWIITHPMQYVLTGKESNLKFDSHKCKNCTAKAVSEFTVEYNQSVAYFGSDQECIGVRGTLRFDENLGGQINDEVEPLKDVPWQYPDYQSVFNGQYSGELPPHHSFDHAIDMVEGKEPPWGPIYALSEKELQVLRTYLNMLRSGKIHPSKSSAGAPILFVPKTEGRGLCLGVDYRSLNKVTMLNRYPLLLMNELHDRVRGAKIFTILDLKSGYNHIRIKEGDEWKTAFRTRYDLFENKVMPFGLANTPATFQNMMNEIFRDMIDLGVVIYLDDILIYSENEHDHVALVKRVLARFQEHQLAIAPDKCEWHRSRVNFLGYIILPKGVEMDQEKIRTVI